MCERKYEQENLQAKILKLEKQLENYRKIVHNNANGEFELKNRFFIVQDNGFILDNSFDFDAGITISGDFIDNQKFEYAQMIANALNNYNKLTKQNELLQKQIEILNSNKK